MKLCTSLRKDGTPCRAKAVLIDPDGHCVWHSSLIFPATKAAHDFTKEEAIKTVGRELRCLRKRRDLDPLQRSSEIRSLITVWQSLTTAEPEALPKPLSLEERIKKVEEKGKVGER